MRFPSLLGFNAEAFKKYFKNTSWFLMAKVGSLMIKMVVSVILLPNYLGGSLFGTYNYPLTFLAFFIGIATLGTDGIVTRELLHKPNLRNQILGSAFRIRLTSGLIALPIVYIAYFLVAAVSTNAPAANFAQMAVVSTVCLIQAFQIIDSHFQSQAQGKYIMLVQVGGNIISAIIIALLIYFKAPIGYFMLTLVLDLCWIQLGYLYFYKKSGNNIRQWKYNGTIARRLIQKGWPLAISTIFASLYLKIGLIMIDSMLGAEKLGVYSNVVKYSESWYFLPGAITAALFPAIMHAKNNNLIHYRKRMQNLFDLMVVISVGIAIVMTLVVPYVFNFLYQNRPEYLEGIPVLQVHIWSGVFVFLSTSSSQYLVAENLTKITLVQTIIGATVNITLNYLLIPQLGIMGAAYATLLALAATLFSVFLFPKARTQGLLILRSITFVSIFQAILSKLRKPASQRED